MNTISQNGIALPAKFSAIMLSLLVFAGFSATALVDSIQTVAFAEPSIGGDITEIAVGAIMVGVLLPISIGLIANANITGWNAAVVTIFTVVLPILIIIGAAMLFFDVARRHMG